MKSLLLTVMDLFCCESNMSATIRAYDDPVLLQDDRVLHNLLLTEERYIVSSSYFKCVQRELKPYMRKVVASWMLEVCEEENCEDEVLPLAMNCMDRFLSIVNIRKSQLQLLGAVCLLISSKLRQSKPLTAEKLCAYTDNSVTLSEIWEWEMLVLGRLKWDLAAITPNDFLDYIIQRLPLAKANHVIKRHAQTFITLCATDFKFTMYPPSMIAAASIASAIQGLMWLEKSWASQTELLNHLHQITGIEVDCLHECLEQIEEMLSSHVNAAHLSTSSKLAETEQNQPETPTDVQDVQF